MIMLQQHQRNAQRRELIGNNRPILDSSFQQRSLKLRPIESQDTRNNEAVLDDLAISPQMTKSSRNRIRFGEEDFRKVACIALDHLQSTLRLTATEQLKQMIVDDPALLHSCDLNWRRSFVQRLIDRVCLIAHDFESESGTTSQQAKEATSLCQLLLILIRSSRAVRMELDVVELSNEMECKSKDNTIAFYPISIMPLLDLVQFREASSDRHVNDDRNRIEEVNLQAAFILVCDCSRFDVTQLGFANDHGSKSEDKTIQAICVRRMVARCIGEPYYEPSDGSSADATHDSSLSNKFNITKLNCQRKSKSNEYNSFVDRILHFPVSR